MDVGDRNVRAFFAAALRRREPDARSGGGRDEHGLPGQQPACGRVLGEVGHFGSFGNPSARSPITFRWI